MSSASLDLVRSIYKAWEQGDFSSAEWADADIEYAVVDGPEPGRWRGLEEMAGSWRSWLRGWNDFRAEPDDFLFLEGDRILALVRNSATGRTSGLELEQRSVANLFELREGKVVRLVIYLEREHAFADLGLTPDTGS
jgi:ketosteroid isomerase-like protein